MTAGSGTCGACKALRAQLESERFTVAHDSNRRHSISACVIRAYGPDGEPTVAIDGNHPKKDQINVVIDGLHWREELHGRPDRLRVVLDQPHPEAADAVRTLARVLNSGSTSLTVELDVRPEPTTGPKALRDWTEALKELLIAGPPERVDELDRLLGGTCPGFRWYPNLTEKYWSGRVEGLEVVRVSADGRRGHLRMGSGGTPSPKSAVATFRELIGDKEGYRFAESRGDLPHAELPEIAHHLQALAAAREHGSLRKFYPEHRLESRILRGDVIVDVDGQQLEPVSQVGQFPTMWSAAGHPRYLDALMRTPNSRVPWAAEIKIAPNSGLPRYYRHGIPQALLYREYIRAVPAVAEFLGAELDLEARRCEAALVVPEASGPAFQSARPRLERLADLFSVRLVTVQA